LTSADETVVAGVANLLFWRCAAFWNLQFALCNFAAKSLTCSIALLDNHFFPDPVASTSSPSASSEFATPVGPSSFQPTVGTDCVALVVRAVIPGGLEVPSRGAAAIHALGRYFGNLVGPPVPNLSWCCEDRVCCCLLLLLLLRL
jgi:hypothetical protein